MNTLFKNLVSFLYFRYCYEINKQQSVKDKLFLKRYKKITQLNTKLIEIRTKLKTLGVNINIELNLTEFLNE